MAVSKVVMPQALRGDGERQDHQVAQEGRRPRPGAATSSPRSRPTRPTSRWRPSAPACCARSCAGRAARCPSARSSASSRSPTRTSRAVASQPGGAAAAACRAERPPAKPAPATAAAAAAAGGGAAQRGLRARAGCRRRGPDAGRRGGAWPQPPRRRARGRPGSRPRPARRDDRAAQAGVDLSCPAHRPAGRSRRDVEAAAVGDAWPRQRARRAHVPARCRGGRRGARRAPGRGARRAPGAEFEDRPLSPMRAAIAKRMPLSQGAGAAFLRHLGSRDGSRHGRCARS